MTQTLTGPERTADDGLNFRERFRRDAGISLTPPPEDDIFRAAYGLEAVRIFTAIVDRWIVDAGTAGEASFYWVLKQIGHDILCLHDQAGFTYGGTAADRHRIELRSLDFHLPHRDGGYVNLELAARDHSHIEVRCIRIARDEGDDEVDEFRQEKADHAPAQRYLDTLWQAFHPAPGPVKAGLTA